MYKSPQSKIASDTEIEISMGAEFEYSSCKPIIFIDPEEVTNLPEKSNGGILSSLSGFFKTSPRTNPPKNMEIIAGIKNTTKTTFCTANLNLRTIIPLYLFSNDKIVQYNYVA